MLGKARKPSPRPPGRRSARLMTAAVLCALPGTLAVADESSAAAPATGAAGQRRHDRHDTSSPPPRRSSTAPVTPAAASSPASTATAPATKIAAPTAGAVRARAPRQPARPATPALSRSPRARRAAAAVTSTVSARDEQRLGRNPRRGLRRVHRNQAHRRSTEQQAAATSPTSSRRSPRQLERSSTHTVTQDGSPRPRARTCSPARADTIVRAARSTSRGRRERESSRG